MRQLIAGVALVLAAGIILGLLSRGDAIADPVASASGRAQIESGIHDCANRNRRAAGLGALRHSRTLARAARLHARNMARLGFFDHTDPRGRGVGERVAIFDRAHRFVGLGENIAAGYRTAALTCQEWMSSAGHRGNILNPTFTHIGAGFARGGPYGRYYVQVFGATISTSSSHLK
jgi:uncharacterized protein YkwD